MENYYMWIEIQANKELILDGDKFKRILARCKEFGFEGIILGVKDTSGFGIYKSDIVPHYSKLEKSFKRGEDYLDKYIRTARDLGLNIYAAIDVFAEGRNNKRHGLSPGFKNRGWQTSLYGLDNSGNPEIKPVSKSGGLRSVSAIDDFDDVFVNPVREDIRKYELDVIRELITGYDLDGFCLDRVRFIGLSADFSIYSREKFEEYLGNRVNSWPEEIYSLEMGSGDKNEELEINYGPLFGEWLTFRAKIIKSFITSVKKVVIENEKNIEFMDYTGSWYPVYYQVGANWASNTYLVGEYPWVDKSYAKTGYAEDIDKLLSGFYYPEVTVKEAEENGRPAYWYSVEGAGKLVSKVTADAVPVIGSLYARQYKEKPEKLEKAIKMCFKISDGCMVFDLSYVVDNNWWEYCKIEENGDPK
ncbi:MAG: alpha amylase family protein [Halanaerobiaceae bacterium]